MSEFVNIKNARKALNLTQKEMGDKCGVGLRTIQNWESGTTKPTEAVMRMIESWLTPDDYERIAQYERANNEAYFTYLLPMSAAGGTLSGFSSEGTRLSDCERVVSPIAEVDFAITVYGDSMSPDYPSGSRITVTVCHQITLPARAYLLKRLTPRHISHGETFLCLIP